jgi:TonB family protein
MKKLNCFIAALLISFSCGDVALSTEKNDEPKAAEQQKEEQRLMQLYVADVRMRLKRGPAYGRNEAPAGTQVTVTFKMSQEGQPTDIKVTSPSGVPGYDESCIKKIVTVSPFRPWHRELLIQTVFETHDITVTLR